jgi:hypothetical protein
VDAWLTLSGRDASAGAASLASVEQKLGLQLPDAMARDYLRADGSQAFVHDCMIRFWPLAELGHARDEQPTNGSPAFDGLVVFADFLIHSHYYAIDASGGPDRGKVAILLLDEPQWVASSWNGFLELCVRNDRRIHWGDDALVAR